jgi:PAS domain S-box-containing protein
VIQSEHLIPVFKATPVPGLLVLADAPRFTIAAVNTAYLEATGLDEAGLLGKGIFEAFPENDHDLQSKLEASLRLALQTGKPHQMDVLRYDLPQNGAGEPRERYWKPENIPVVVDRQVVCIINTVKDVTAETLIETELEENARAMTEKFEGLIQAIDGIFWEADAQTLEYTYVSPQVGRILGYTHEQWKDEPGFWEKHIYPADRDTTVSFSRRMIQALEDHRFEYRMIAADGRIVWLHDIVSVIAVEGRPAMLKGLMIDITKTKRAEEFLDAAEKRYGLLFHTSPLAKWIYDLDTFRILDVNETAVLHYGYSREEFLGMSINQIRCSEDAPGLFEAVYYANRHAQMFSKGVHRHVKKNGDIIHVELQKNIIDFNGTRAALILSNDITDRVKSIAAIEEQNQKLNAIAFTQSHRVRVPLARMMEIIGTLKDRDNHPEELTELAGSLLESARELDSMMRLQG